MNTMIINRDTVHFRKVSRVEVIDSNGRVYASGIGVKDVHYQLQDDGKTLKIFLENKRK